MTPPVTIALLAISILALYISCVWLVKSVTKIARYFKLSDFVIGFVIVGFATSIPELVVGITSALNNVADLSIGNVLGTNVVDITLIFGIVVLLARMIPVKGKIRHEDIIIAGIIGALPIFLALDKNLSRLDGIILIAVFAIYLFLLLNQKHYFEKPTHRTITHSQFIINAIIFVSALAILIFASRGVVLFGSELALEIGVPLLFIGIIFVAIGTSLPELAFESRAAVSGKPLMAIGDILGSIAANSALVVGVTILIQPHDFTTGFGDFLFPALAFIFCYAIFAIFLFTRKHLSWREGTILIFLYMVFLVVSIYLFR